MKVGLKLFRFNGMKLIDLPDITGDLKGFIAKDLQGRRSIYYGPHLQPSDPIEFLRYALKNGHQTVQDMFKEAYEKNEPIEIFGKHVLQPEDYRDVIEEVLFGALPSAQIVEICR